MPKPVSLPEAFYQRLIDHVRDGIYFLDTQRRISYWNKGAERITGYTAEDVLGFSCADNILVHVAADGSHLCVGLCPVMASLGEGTPQDADIFLHHKDGHRVPVHVHIEPLYDASGRIAGVVETFVDTSERNALLQQVEELRQIAFLDELTKLANRRLVESTLQARLAELRRYQWPFGVLMLDIDHFKVVNDTYGHAIGDNVLQMVSQTLAHTARPFDLVGRWGGEEFLAIVSNVTAEELPAIAERMRHLIAASFITVDGQPLRVTASFGATLAVAADTTDTLIARCDALLYTSKMNGRNCVSTDAQYPPVTVG